MRWPGTVAAALVLALVPVAASPAASAARPGPRPVLTQAAPASGSTAGGYDVVLRGKHLTGLKKVTFGGTRATGVRLKDARRVVVTAPAHAPGTVALSVVTKAGASKAVDFTYVAPAPPPPVPPAPEPPTLARLSPAAGATGGGDLVTLTGSRLARTGEVRFGGTAASVVSVAEGAVTVRSPARPPGVVSVTATTPDGTATLQDAFTYLARPSVTSVLPGSGPLGGSRVTLIGSGFTADTRVAFGESPAADVRVEDEGRRLTAQAPAAAAPGPVDVTVTTPGGSDRLLGGYRYVAGVSVTAVVPAAGPSAGGTTVRVLGSGFTGSTLVVFGDRSSPEVRPDLDGAGLTAVLPAHAAGAVDVLVATAGGSATLASGFTFVDAPTLTSLTPGAGPTAGGTLVALSGTGFRPGMTALLGGAEATVVSVDPAGTSAVVRTPAHVAGAVDVSVTTPGGTASLPTAFTYVVAPTLVAVGPSEGPAGGSQRVALSGSGFREGMQVSFGGVPATGLVVVSPTSASVLTPAHAAGPVAVAVSTPGGTASLASGYTYVDAPTLTAVAPTTGPVGGGTLVALTGSGFREGMEVRFGGAPAAVVGMSPGSATVLTPAHAAGPVAVTVTTPGGTAPLVGAFTYLDGPALTAVSPSAGPAGGGTTVALTGSGFRPGMSVRFGGAPATLVSVDSGSSATVLAPAHAPGVVDVSLVTPGGSASLAGGFEYVVAPELASVSPSSGPSAGGASVTLSGAGFRAGMSVRFGGAAASVVSVNGAGTTAVVTTGASAPGVVDVSVSTVGGSVSSVAAYEYVAAPTLTGVSPGAGSTVGGESVTLTGTGFRPGMQVRFGGDLATVTASTPTSATVTTPSHAAGVVDVSVATVGGTATAASAYEFVAAPTLTAVSPSAGPTAGGEPVTLTGTGFRPGMQVRVGGDLATVPASSATSATVTTPAHAAGLVDVSVATAGGAATAASAYEYVAAPTLTGVSPGAGPTTGGEAVALTGTGFRPGMQVRFGGDLAAVTASTPTSRQSRRRRTPQARST